MKLFYELLRLLLFLPRLKDFGYVYNSRRTWLNCKIFCSGSKRFRISVHRGKLESLHDFNIFKFLFQCLLFCQIGFCCQFSQFNFLLVIFVFTIDNSFDGAD